MAMMMTTLITLVAMKMVSNKANIEKETLNVKKSTKKQIPRVEQLKKQNN